jgi:RNA polymerase sigma factor (sigma-70 family)
MPQQSYSTFVQSLHFLVAAWKEDTRTDKDLLCLFIHTRNEQAFATLVGRHSKMVWNVCLRILKNCTDAEDALQAAFLRLARDASLIINQEAVAPWLYRVARDCSIDLQRSIIRQRRITERAAERPLSQVKPAPDDELQLQIDDELSQLPDLERAVVVLCCLEGRTFMDAAVELGCSPATVHRRFLSARTRLRRRLAVSGPAASVLGAMLGSESTSAAGASPAPATTLSGILKDGMTLAKTGRLPTTRAGQLALIKAASKGLKTVAGIAIGLTAVAVILGGYFYSSLISSPPTVEPDSRLGRQVVAAESGEVAESAVKKHTAVTGVVRGPDGKPVAGAEVVAMARKPFGPAERGLRDKVLVTTKTDAKGRFGLKVPNDFDTWFLSKTVTLQASGPSFAPVTLPVHLDPLPHSVELKLSSASELRAKLLDEVGHPAAGVRVEVVRVGDAVSEPVVGGGNRSSLPAWPDVATSSADGTFTLPALGGATNVWVRVLDPRYALDSFHLEAKPNETSILKLAPARPLTVIVRAADTKAILPGARVTVITDRVEAHPHFCSTAHGLRGPSSMPADIDAVTDQQGQVRVTLAPGDKAEVLVHPADESGPYVGVRSRLEVKEGENEVKCTVYLPRGRWVTGAVKDASTGRPVSSAAVHWGRENARLAEWRDHVLTGRDAITRTDANGLFKIAVLTGAVSIRVYGVTPDFEPVFAKLPGTRRTPIFAHSMSCIEVPETGDVPQVEASIHPAQTVTGYVDRPANDSGATFLLASGRVSPVRGYATLPLAVSQGVFTVPGCRTGHTTRIYLLDPVARFGGVVDVTPRSASPKAKLQPCGSISLKVVDAEGKPIAGQKVNVSLGVARDYKNDAIAELQEDLQPLEWFDAINYPAISKTGEDGRVELKALIPGARYTVSIGSGANKFSTEQMIEAGQKVTLADVVLPTIHNGEVR